MPKAKRQPKKNAYDYDLVVIGSGPGGQRAAMSAAKLGKKVLVIEKNHLGGSCLHTGTIPSKTLRETALSCGADPDSLNTVMTRKNQVIREEVTIIQDHFERNLIECTQGVATFLNPRELVINNESLSRKVSARFFVIATGTRPNRPKHIPFDDKVVVDSDSLLNIKTKPAKLLIMGAGVIGLEYASILGSLGVEVTIVDPRDQVFPWMDREVVKILERAFVEQNIKLVLNSEVQNIELKDKKVSADVLGKKESFDVLLFCGGRVGNTEDLKLNTLKLKLDSKGMIPVNDHFQTSVPHVYAVGDVIGNPALASASAEQGRLAAAHAFHKKMGKFPKSFPFGIYTIPELSSVGMTEEEIKKAKIPYVTGRAYFNEIARGKIVQDSYGFLKMLFHKKTRKLLGVHIIGTNATELVHIGQTVFMFGGGIDFFIENVFNYPTLAEAYKIAAYNAYHQFNK